VRLAKEGNIAVPSWLAKLTALLAGHDYDGDGATLVDSKGLLGKLVVDLFFEHITPMAIPYGPAESKNSEKYRFDIDAMDKAYLYAVENPNEPIGKLVIAAYKFGGIAVAVEQGQLTQSMWETLLANNIKRFFINNRGENIPEFSDSTDLFRANVVVDNGEYVPFFKEGEEIPVITNSVIREFTYHIYKYGIKNVNNLKMVCKELQIIYSPVVGKTIDSTKSPDDVHAPLIWLANMFGGSIKTKLDCKYEAGRFSCWTNKPGLNCWKKKGLDGKEETIVSFNLNDIFFQLYSFSAYTIENMSNRLLECGSTNFVVPNYNNAPQSAKDYASCVAHLGEMFSGIQKFDPEQTARLKPLFVDSVRSMTKDLDYRSRATIIKMATHKGDGEYFGTREVFGIELLHNSGVENVIATEKLYGYDMNTEFEEGSVVHLEKGRGENCFTKAPITGDFEIAFESNGDDSDPVVVVQTSVYEYMESFDNHRDIVMFKLNLGKNDDAEKVANLLASLSMSDNCKFVTTANAVHKNRLHIYLGKAYKSLAIYTPSVGGGQMANNIFEKHLDLKEINVVDVVYYEDGKGKPCVVVVGEIIRSVTDPAMALY
jgi:hypothetical protein